MKHKKFWKGVLSFLGVVIAVTAINMGIKVAMEGMWLLGIPEPEAVSSVTIKHQHETEQIMEITDPEQIETCVHLSGFLKYRPFADPEAATGKASPRITFWYHLNSGDTVEVAANANTVFYNGKEHVLKDEDSFVDFVEGLFFTHSVLYGKISEIADGNLLIEADGRNYIVYDWMEYIPTGPSFEIGDEVAVTHHGIAPEEEPGGLYGVSRIDLTHDEYVRKYGTADEKGLGDTPIIIDGVEYTNTHEAVPVEPDESAIEYAEIPVGGGSTISAFARLENGTLLVCRIDGEWYKFQATVPGGQPADGILIPYSQQADGTWQANGISYRYRLEIAGRMPHASADSTFVYLSNLESIPFEKAYKAAGFSSNLDDYYPAEDAVLVEWTLK